MCLQVIINTVIPTSTYTYFIRLVTRRADHRELK